VLDELAPSVKNLLHEWRKRKGTAQLVRYEDLIADPEPVLRSVLRYAGIDASAEQVAATLARAAEPAPGMETHRTAGPGDASVGRWRRELEPDLQELCAEVFAESLAEFGYERHGGDGRAR
jgi:hypothetical protein